MRNLHGRLARLERAVAEALPPVLARTIAEAEFRQLSDEELTRYLRGQLPLALAKGPPRQSRSGYTQEEFRRLPLREQQRALREVLPPSDDREADPCDDLDADLGGGGGGWLFPPSW
jgi:hypothetical protein